MNPISKALDVLDMSKDGVLYRNKSRRITATMLTEFKFILTDYFNIEELNQDIYEKEFTNHYENYEIPNVNGIYYCICSHEITHLNFIEHIKTGIVIQVGNCCVRKIAPRQADLLKCFLDKKLCICKHGKIDERLKSGKIWAICESCYQNLLSVGDDIIKFGQHKGTSYKRLCQKKRNYVIDFLLRKNIIKDKKVGIYLKMELDLPIPDADLNDWPFPEKKVIKSPLTHKFLLK